MGHIAQLFESGEQTSQQGHFRNLVLIARHDGSILDSENKLLLNLANKLSLNEKQIQEIIDHPNDYPVIPPVSREERYERFVQLLQMALVDGVLSHEESRFVKRLGIALGFTEQRIEEIFQVIVDKIQKGIKRDEIVAGLL